MGYALYPHPGRTRPEAKADRRARDEQRTTRSHHRCPIAHRPGRQAKGEQVSDGMDYYDVQNMIRDARHEVSSEISREVGYLRSDMHVALSDLRAGLADLA